ncbi:MAG TPA: hypothetical protein VF930_03720 [Stellaceae bacterium]
MIARTPLLIAATLLALAAPAWAQSEGSMGSQGTVAAPPTPPKSSNFESLSAGDRKIGRALFLAQRPTATGPAPLSLNQIADLKARSTWAKVFNQMQSRGLLQAKTLGQIVNGYERQHGDARPPARSGAAGGSPTLVTGGNGSVTASSERGGIAHGGDVVGETGTPDLAAANRADRPARPASVDRRGR